MNILKQGDNANPQVIEVLGTRKSIVTSMEMPVFVLVSNLSGDLDYPAECLARIAKMSARRIRDK